MVTSVYTATTPTGTATIYEGLQTAVIPNAIDITGGASSYVLTKDGKIYQTPLTSSLCNPAALLTSIPSAAPCNSLAYNLVNQFVVASNGGLYAFNGTWTFFPVAGTNFTKVVMSGNTAIAFGTGGKIYKVTF